MILVRKSSNKCHLYLPGNWLICFAINRPCAGADGFYLKIPQNGVIGNFTELAENPTLQELAVSNHRRDVPVA
jgi:hypothetical protein